MTTLATITRRLAGKIFRPLPRRLALSLLVGTLLLAAMPSARAQIYYLGTGGYWASDVTEPWGGTWRIWWWN